MKKATKKATKKVVNKVVVEGKENKSEMVSYEMKMTIPTGQYANIQPCIVVKGGSIEEAHDFIAPHMNKLWKDYFMITERPAPVTPAPKAPVKPVEKAPEEPAKPVEKAPEAPKIAPEEPKKPDEPITPPPAPASTVAFNKASQAITSCMSREALELIAAQVEKSVKLDDAGKVELRKLIETKSKDFDEKSK